MKNELVLIVNETINKDTLNNIIDNIKTLITNEKGEIIEICDLGVRKFPFPIQKLERGQYFDIIFKSDYKFIEILDKKLKNNENLIKYLIVDDIQDDL